MTADQLRIAVCDDLGDRSPSAALLLAFHLARGAIAARRGEIHVDHLARDRHLELAYGVFVAADGRCSEVACSPAGRLAIVLATGALDRTPRTRSNARGGAK